MIASGGCDVEKTYAGPKLPQDDSGKYSINLEFVHAMLEWFKEGKTLPDGALTESIRIAGAETLAVQICLGDRSGRSRYFRAGRDYGHAQPRGRHDLRRHRRRSWCGLQLKRSAQSRNADTLTQVNSTTCFICTPSLANQQTSIVC